MNQALIQSSIIKDPEAMLPSQNEDANSSDYVHSSSSYSLEVCFRGAGGPSDVQPLDGAFFNAQ
jgi:hypothetical protein